MRPLPRLFAITTDTLCRAADFGIRAAAIAASGPAVALVVRAPESTTAQHAAFVERVQALARPPEAALFVHARPDLARATLAAGIHLRQGDLSAQDARELHPGAWVGVSVHDLEEARRALDQGADYLVAGRGGR
ncbi:MAG: hypothetical protein HOP28_17140, partial [Gemmatimonadales bacterium]|nr:hypothetical protein [Gemmatimonadales bacterium]